MFLDQFIFVWDRLLYETRKISVPLTGKRSILCQVLWDNKQVLENDYKKQKHFSH